MRTIKRAGTVLAAVAALAACVRTPPAGRPVVTRPTQSPAPLVGGLVDRPIDGGTRAAVSRAGGDLQRCAAELTAARVRFSPVPDRVDSETCGLTDAGVLGPDLGTVARMAPGDVTVTCETALALSIWRRQSLEPAAREILGSDVVQIDHYGVYACRPVNNGRGSTRPSAHGRAAALDFAGVRLRDGRRITVAADWSGDDAEARFLRRIRDDACRIFGTTLSPDYNAVHHDHLHLEAGRPGLCS